MNGNKPKLSILSNEEHRALVFFEGTRKVVESAEKKLALFQEMRTSKEHISSVDELIPYAEKYAMKHAKKLPNGGVDRRDLDRLFHQRMNTLTRAAGLRR